LRNSLASLTPTDAQFQDAFATAKVSNARLARYYLRSLELTAKEESEPWLEPINDSSVINLEHVLPRKPEENWPQFNEDQVNSHATRLGNLALLRASDNSDIRNGTFAEKKITFAKSPYVLTQQLADPDDWTTASIDERQKVLAELAIKTWPIK
jgi:hypothetical protein